MFSLTRPTAATIEQFIGSSQELPLSYGPVGIVERTPRRRVDEEVVAIGRGMADFERARSALSTWQQFDIGWVTLFPRNAPTAVGTVVAVVIRHFGFWSMNGCRVVYSVGDDRRHTSFGYAYGTLTNHAEAGEELFEIFLDPQTDDVMYRIRAASWPYAMLTRVGQPLVRVLQARFRTDSIAAMKRATRAAGQRR
jgi:uncharacterized protein (UPF0548 family)